MPHMLSFGAALTAPATFLWAWWAARKWGKRWWGVADTVDGISKARTHTVASHCAGGVHVSTNTISQRHGRDRAEQPAMTGATPDPTAWMAVTMLQA